MPPRPTRDLLFERHRPLCRRAARRFVRSGTEISDLEQVASIGLIKACDRYDQQLAPTFRRYAWLSIIGELMHYVRDLERPIRLPRHLDALDRRYRRAERHLRQRLDREPNDADIRRELDVDAAQWARVCMARRAAATPVSIDAASALSSDGETAATLERIELKSLMAALPRLQRTVLIGIHACGFSKPELAERLGYSTRHLARVERAAISYLQARLS